MRFALNTKKAQNYAFYDTESRLHLTLSHPVGQADRVTSGIRRGLSSKAITSLDNEVPPVEPGKSPISEIPPVVETPVEVQAEEVAPSVPAEEVIQEELPAVAEEKIEEEEVKAEETAPAVDPEPAAKKKGGKKSAQTEE